MALSAAAERNIALVNLFISSPIRTGTACVGELQGSVQELYPLVKWRLQLRGDDDEMVRFAGDPDLATRLRRRREARAEQKGSARLLRPGPQPEGLRRRVTAFRRDLHPAQPQRRRRAG